MIKCVRQEFLSDVSQKVVYRDQISEPSVAFESFEKVADFVEFRSFKSVVLDEFITCGS